MPSAFSEDPRGCLSQPVAWTRLPAALPPVARLRTLPYLTGLPPPMPMPCWRCPVFFANGFFFELCNASIFFGGDFLSCLIAYVELLGLLSSFSCCLNPYFLFISELWFIQCSLFVLMFAFDYRVLCFVLWVLLYMFVYFWFVWCFYCFYFVLCLCFSNFTYCEVVLVLLLFPAFHFWVLLLECPAHLTRRPDASMPLPKLWTATHLTDRPWQMPMPWWRAPTVWTHSPVVPGQTILVTVPKIFHEKPKRKQERNKQRRKITGKHKKWWYRGKTRFEHRQKSSKAT